MQQLDWFQDRLNDIGNVATNIEHEVAKDGKWVAGKAVKAGKTAAPYVLKGVKRVVTNPDAQKLSMEGADVLTDRYVPN